MGMNGVAMIGGVAVAGVVCVYIYVRLYSTVVVVVDVVLCFVFGS